MTTSLILPCGRTADVAEFNGTAQKHVSDFLQSMEAGRTPSIDWEDKILAEVVTSLGRRRPTPRDLLDLPAGSRLRLMVAARRLTYGDELTMEWVCAGRSGCGAKNERTLSLADLVDTPYPSDRARFRASDGTVFTLGFGTGHTQSAFSRAAMRREVGFLDEPLTRVLEIDNAPRGLHLVMKLSGKVLDEVRAAGRAMVPVFDPEARTAADREAEAAEATPALPAGGAEGTDANAMAKAAESLAPVGADDVVTDPSRMPSAGCPERARLTCDHCGRRGLVPIATQPDFLFRGVTSALEE